MWITIKYQIDFYIDNRYYSRNKEIEEIENRDKIIAIDDSTLGIRSKALNAMICKTKVRVNCPYCNKPKILAFYQFVQSVALHHKSCVTRYRNYNERDYSDPVFKKKISDFHKGKIISEEIRKNLSKALKGKVSHRKGKHISEQHRNNIKKYYVNKNIKEKK